jgi:hypothetical protein
LVVVAVRVGALRHFCDSGFPLVTGISFIEDDADGLLDAGGAASVSGTAIGGPAGGLAMSGGR